MKDYRAERLRCEGRRILDGQGFFPELPVHRDGSRWVYWAEEVEVEEASPAATPGAGEEA